jgi:inhibitor of cysteine peptidase
MSPLLPLLHLFQKTNKWRILSALAVLILSIIVCCQWTIDSAGATWGAQFSRQTFRPEGQKSMLSITEQQDGTTVHVASHDLLQITLLENASTGFRWAVDQFDKQILELVDSEADYKPNTLGASGEVSFLFRARAPGASTIELKNWRHWEGDSSITRRFHLQVQVDH